MPTPFLSSEEYDEKAHELYNEGQYDAALEMLREGLALYPHAVELHVGVGYARLAREEYAWAKLVFEKALVLDAEHEDALAGYGETLLRFGQREEALRHFRRILELGYEDDIDLVLQVGRALFREGLVEESAEFFDAAVQEAPESAEALALLGYARHRLGDEERSVRLLRQALRYDDSYAEARIYLANILYDRGDYETALYHLERTSPEDHWDELGIWRLVELRKGLRGAKDEDPSLRQWDERLTELSGVADDVDEMLAEIEQKFNETEEETRGQLELFGSLLGDLAERHPEKSDTFAMNVDGVSLSPMREPVPSSPDEQVHEIEVDGNPLVGSWEDIVRLMRDADQSSRGRTLEEYMLQEARRAFRRTGARIPTHDAESFIRASAGAGLLRIVR